MISSRNPLRDKVAFAGAATTGMTATNTGRSQASLAAEACIKVLRESGLTAKDVDGICGTSPTAPYLQSMLGIPEGEVAIDWNAVIFNMLTIKGIYGREIFETWYKMTTMLQGGLNLDALITHRLPYTEFEQGFAAAIAGEAGKVVLRWD